ncbi:MAG: hypothetical protein PHE89_07625 [Alphaproteobacteria bacterium]|nr:hypothetical protein [Alphaproteobacteria bacterium]
MIGYLVLLVAILSVGCFLFAINHQRKSKRKSSSHFIEQKELQPYNKFCGQEYVLDRESGRFFHLDYETPVEELSEVIVQTSLYHNCFLYFSGKIKVKIAHFYYSEQTDQVIAVCRADLSFMLDYEKETDWRYLLFNNHVTISLYVGENSNGTMDYFNSDYAHEVEGGKFKLEIMLRDCEYGGHTNIYLKRDPNKYFNKRYF